MPTRNISLTEQLDEFIDKNVASGQFQNSSEVVRAALRAFQEQQEMRSEWLAYLRTAAAEGFAELDAGKARSGTPADLMAEIGAEVSKRIDKSWPPSSSPRSPAPR